MDRELRKRFLDAEKRESAKLYALIKNVEEKKREHQNHLNALIKNVEEKKREHQNHLNELFAERQQIQNILNQFGLKVRTVEDFKVMTELWNSGFDHLYVEMSQPMSDVEVDEMKQTYGMDLDFEFWNVSFECLSDARLEEHFDYFKIQHAIHARHKDRHAHIMNVIHALMAEKKRRETEEMKRSSAVRVIHKLDSWRVSKFHD